MRANFVVGKTTHSFLAQILVLERVLNDKRVSSILWSQRFAMRSSPHHSSALHTNIWPMCYVFTAYLANYKNDKIY